MPCKAYSRARRRGVRERFGALATGALELIEFLVISITDLHWGGFQNQYRAQGPMQDWPSPQRL